VGSRSEAVPRGGGGAREPGAHWRGRPVVPGDPRGDGPPALLGGRRADRLNAWGRPRRAPLPRHTACIHSAGNDTFRDAIVNKRGSRNRPAINHRTRVGQQRRARTRSHIITTALSVFAAKGPDAPVI